MTFKQLKNTLSENVKRLPCGAYISARDLSSGAKLSLRTIQEIENGQVDVRLKTVYKISEFLGVSPSYLIDAPVHAEEIGNLQGMVRYIDQNMANLEAIKRLTLKEIEKRKK